MYSVALADDVGAGVAAFDQSTRRYWNVFLALIAEDPHPRWGYYVDRPIPIRGFPSRTFNYWIEPVPQVSGENVFSFQAEFMPQCVPVYAVSEERQEIEVFARREGWI